MLNNTGPNAIPCITLVGNFSMFDTLPFFVVVLLCAAPWLSVNPHAPFLGASVN